MKKYISKNYIHEIISKTNIIDLIKSYILIKKKGKQYQACCPFHVEKVPSFTINEEKQFYYCFGCHAHGNVIDFLMNYEQLNFIETIEYLSTLHNIPICYTNNTKNFNNIYKKRQNLFKHAHKISIIYQKNLIKNKKAKKYLQNRKINEQTINLFKLGFASTNYAKIDINNNKKHKIQKILQKTGILIKKKNGTIFDLLYQRIIFPIRDKFGKVNGFGGRVINNNQPKYLNSAETEIFNKKQQLYGLYELLQITKNPKKIIVVEGYLDVLTLFQHNINYATAILGTNINNHHIVTLFRYTNEIIYCYDNDDAGNKAAWNTLKKVLPYIDNARIVKFIFLPKGEDPDTIIQKEGIKKFKKRIKKAKTLSSYLFKKILKKKKIQSTEEKTKFSSKIIPLINTIPNNIMRFYLYKKLGNKIGVLDINKFNYFPIKKIKKKKKTKIKNIFILISLLVQNPRLANIIPSIFELKYLKFNGIKTFKKIVQLCIKNKKITTGQILEYYRGKKTEKILKILSIWDHLVHHNSIEIFFLDTLIMIFNKKLKNIQKKLIEKDRKSQLNKVEKCEFWLINKELKKK
ncbi:DNA primase [Buchnera aphidicola (Mollitrichosiphum nigrofasciatum)]|uniref:DNA primase n=1 Tax=Buchnera aphidicola TaxID=9 RepID=UPI0031B87A0E